MRDVVIAGIGMTPFRRAPGTGLRALATAASDEALKDAGLSADAVDRVYFGNAIAGTVTHQDMIKGQAAFRRSDLAGLPVINVENACASGSSALQMAVEAVSAGFAEVVLAVGAEQMTHEDRTRSFRALRGSTDIVEIGEAGPDEDWTKSVLMEFYSAEARGFLERNGATVEDLALVAVKNRTNAASNPLAQFSAPQDVAGVLASRIIVPPLTLAMCSPLSDGAAAAVVCSAEYARSRLPDAEALAVRGCVMRGGRAAPPVVEASSAVYEVSGVPVTDMDLIELHDAAAPAELIQYGEIGLCAPGEEHLLIRRGDTDLGGPTPVNTSGGLLSRGHALGATGLAQIAELATQLRGRAGPRQVEDARVALAVNNGGWMGGTYAVTVATVLERAPRR